jgi:hypothetical protein
MRSIITKKIRDNPQKNRRGGLVFEKIPFLSQFGDLAFEFSPVVIGGGRICLSSLQGSNLGFEFGDPFCHWFKGIPDGLPEIEYVVHVCGYRE